MTTYLLIAGHGPQRDGSFDPGATGYIQKGEYKYMVEDLFPAMRKYQKGSDTFIYFSEHKVSNHGSLKRLVDYYKADEVIEFHFDAFNNTARGGHVIIHSAYSPDSMDLRLKYAIGSMMEDGNFDGLRFSHKSHRGISGRSDLYNVNMARENGITYRLLELGFGTNKREANIMINRVDEYAKKLIEAILDISIKDNVVELSKPIAIVEDKPGDHHLNFNQVVSKAISGGYGNMPERANNINSQTKFSYSDIQKEINLRLNGTRSTSDPEPVFEVGSQVTISKNARSYATGQTIPARIKGNTYTIQQVESNRVLLREIYSWVRKSDLEGFSLPKRSINSMAEEIINNPNVPTGHVNRRNWLGISQSEYNKVRARVNEIL